jgi:N-acyl-D-aspartate/D-glutamate deacylase
VALARVAAEAGGLYATHMRDEGAGLLDSVREALRIGEEGGVPVQISHHKASGRANWGRVRESLLLIEQARARGLDATADQYPYTAASTVLGAVIDGIDAAPGDAKHLPAEDVVLASTPHDPSLEGRSLAEIAAATGEAPAALARRVLERDGGAAWVVLHVMCEEDVRCVLRHPTTMIGSDGIPTDGGKPHPRLYGTFARVLGHYCREAGLFPLEEAVHRMTGLPAAKFGLAGRGLLREGFAADLVVFDPARIDDVASFGDPRRSPAGVRHVIVNGTAVVSDGAHTGARPGQALRRSSAPHRSRSVG